MRTQLREGIFTFRRVVEQSLFLSGSAAQVRRVWAGRRSPGSRTSWGGCGSAAKSERRSCEARPPPPHNGRRRAHGRAEALRPSSPGARGRGRRVRVPRPTATRGENEPRPPPGVPGRSPRPGAPRGRLASFSRLYPHAVTETFVPWRGARSNLSRIGGAFYLGVGATRKCGKDFSTREAKKCCSWVLLGVKGEQRVHGCNNN